MSRSRNVGKGEEREREERKEKKKEKKESSRKLSSFVRVRKSDFIPFRISKFLASFLRNFDRIFYFIFLFFSIKMLKQTFLVTTLD